MEWVLGQSGGGVAVRFGDVVLTYGELAGRVERLAWVLRSRGVGVGSLVGVCLRRSLDVPVVWLAVLRLGAAFVPLDPEYPADRLGFMLADSGARVLVTRGDLVEGLPEHDADVLLVDEVDFSVSAGPVAAEVGLSDVAYVIYTSGSTGRPKGVLVEHGGLANLVAVAGADARVLQFSSPSFDGAVWETFMALAWGGCVVSESAGRGFSADELVGQVVAEGVTHVMLPPSVLSVVDELPCGW
ncbi:AMP-binding protein [Streptomyces sp. CS014]|uniref:AMP-binding protein n=1 Tax=Streptomyces sp. CS014 TaxID=2162707 RepID=UPI000D50B48F|nr:AMP-binding protein [Streptomyces sp. CS014]PVD03262.1 hypothetical protein DBP12_04935 [Streptomyces sp. CS014]PVD03265.1 hypothetical protein DBP12_04950 [Streptomyces sp. CS014]